MNLYLSLAGHLLSLLGALVALIGLTWTRNDRGQLRLTALGWVAALIAASGISISGYQSTRVHFGQIGYEEIAEADIRGGWRQAVSPWLLVFEEIVGRRVCVDTSNLRGIMENDYLSQFDQFDLTKLSHVQQYRDLTLGNLFCTKSRVGVNIMHSYARSNPEYISRDLAVQIDTLRQAEMFSTLLSAGCGDLRGDSPDYELFSGAFSSDEGIAYLHTLVEIGELISAPDCDSDTTMQGLK